MPCYEKALLFCSSIHLLDKVHIFSMGLFVNIYFIGTPRLELIMKQEQCNVLTCSVRDERLEERSNVFRKIR